MENVIMFCSFLTVLLFLSIACPAICQEVEDESEFSYGLDSENGPHRWGKLHEEWRMCSNGSMQSPIDLLNERVEIDYFYGRLKRNYKPVNATLINRGHDMMLRWESDAGHIHINETQYQLRQLHWHSPSEHTINGKRYDLEAHLVHESTDGRTAVVGIMYEIGHPDSFLSMMEEDLEALAHTRGVRRVVGIINPKQIKIGSRKHYRYIGSLTVPPCTQNVVWTMIKKIRTVTKEQVELIREAVHDDSEVNARPTQPINERSVKLYRPMLFPEQN